MSTSQLPLGERPGDSLAQVLNYQSHTNICTRSLVTTPHELKPGASQERLHLGVYVERGEQHSMTTLCIPSSARMCRLVGQPG